MSTDIVVADYPIADPTRVNLVACDQQYLRLCALVSSKIQNSELAVRLVGMLDSIAGTKKDSNGNLYAGMLLAPASVAHHHSYTGGLVSHILEMWEIYQESPYLHGADMLKAQVTTESILLGIIVHDLHKAVYNYRICTKEEFEKSGRIVAYSDHMSVKHLNPDQRTMAVLAEHGIALPVLQLNALFSSEGGYAKNPPQSISVLAKTLYLLDDMSANVVDCARTGTIYGYKVDPTNDCLNHLSN